MSMKETETFQMGQVDSDRDGKISVDKQGPEDVMNVKKGDKQLTPGWKTNGTVKEGVWSDEAGEQHVAGGATGTDVYSEIQADKQGPEDVMNLKRGDKQLSPGWKNHGTVTESEKLECMECGKKFKGGTMDPKCPKCGSHDIDLAERYMHEMDNGVDVGPGDEGNSMERGDGTFTGGDMREQELSEKNWIANAVKNKGGLHRGIRCSRRTKDSAGK